MNPYTYTLVVKLENSDNLKTLIREKLGTKIAEMVNPVWAKTLQGGEALILLHTENDSSEIGFKLSDWLGEMPYYAPFPEGSLLWYR